MECKCTTTRSAETVELTFLLAIHFSSDSKARLIDFTRIPNYITKAQKIKKGKKKILIPTEGAKKEENLEPYMIYLISVYFYRVFGQVLIEGLEDLIFLVMEEASKGSQLGFSPRGTPCLPT